MRTPRPSIRSRAVAFALALALPATAAATATGAAADAVNPAPSVVPALQQWEGEVGSVGLSTRIVFDTAESAELAPIADQVVQDASDLFGETWTVAPGATATAGDLVLDLDTAAAVGPDAVAEAEGYRLLIDDVVTVTARTGTGVFWGTRSVLQARLGSTAADDALPRGEAVDWPNYAVRGYMLDLGRRWQDPAVTQDYVRLASWFKMNTLQLHLNDNSISAPNGNWQAAYAGFRLASDNPELAGLASDDGAFTRAQWDELEDLAASQRVTIVPEIDTPAHSAALIQFRPSLGLNGGNSDHLDLTKPATTEFVLDLWDEFLPWFRSPVVHFGADEYPRQYAAQYQTFFNALAGHLSAAGKDTRAWGSFTYMSGSDDGYASDVSMQAWNTGFYSGPASLADGRETINSNDTMLYVVPFADYYHGHGLNGPWLFSSWEPHVFGTATDPAPKAPGLLGAIAAVWNDLTSAEYGAQDVFGLLEPTWGVLAQKMWSGTAAGSSYGSFMQRVVDVTNGPGIQVLETTLVEEDRPLTVVNRWPLDESGTTVDDVVSGVQVPIGTHATRTPGVSGGSLRFPGTGGVTLGQGDLTGSWTVGMWVRRTADTGSSALLSGPGMALKLEQYSNTHRLGMTVFGAADDVSGYVTPLNDWVYVTYVGGQFQTRVYANGELVGTFDRSPDLGRTYLGQILRNNNADSLKADLDDVVVFDGALSATQVGELYSSVSQPGGADEVSVSLAQAAPGPVLPGSSVAVQATVTNTGSTTLAGVTLGGPALGCELPEQLAADEAAQCTFSVPVAAGTAVGTEVPVDVAAYGHRADGPQLVTGRTSLSLVVGSAAPAVEAAVTGRCLAGTAYLYVSARNTGDDPVNVTVQTTYRSKTFTQIAPDHVGAAALPTRLTSIPAGQASFEITTGTGTSTLTVEYPALSCTAG